MDYILGICMVLGWFFIIAVCIQVIIVLPVKLIKKKSIKGIFTDLNPMISNSGKDKYVSYTFTIGIIIGIMLIVLPYTPLGSERIGSIFEKKDYTQYYYANLFPDESNSKNYKVIAEIEAHDKMYRLNKAYFSDGGYKNFDSYFTDESLNFEEPVYIEDNAGNKWTVQLIDEQPIQKKIDTIRESR
ncbi:MAG: hypothetical protein ACRCSD_11140 [Clostridium sp.]